MYGGVNRIYGWEGDREDTDRCQHTWKACARSTWSSVLTVTRSRGLPLPDVMPVSAVSFSRTGERILHGPHQLSFVRVDPRVQQDSKSRPVEKGIKEVQVSVR